MDNKDYYAEEEILKDNISDSARASRDVTPLLI